MAERRHQADYVPQEGQPRCPAGGQGAWERGAGGQADRGGACEPKAEARGEAACVEGAGGHTRAKATGPRKQPRR